MKILDSGLFLDHPIHEPIWGALFCTTCICFSNFRLKRSFFLGEGWVRALLTKILQTRTTHNTTNGNYTQIPNQFARSQGRYNDPLKDHFWDVKLGLSSPACPTERNLEISDTLLRCNFQSTK